MVYPIIDFEARDEIRANEYAEEWRLAELREREEDARLDREVDSYFLGKRDLLNVARFSDKTVVESGALCPVKKSGFFPIVPPKAIDPEVVYYIHSLKGRHVVVGWNSTKNLITLMTQILVEGGVAIVNVDEAAQFCHPLASKVVVVRNYDKSLAYLTADTELNVAKKLTKDSGGNYLKAMEQAVKRATPNARWIASPSTRKPLTEDVCLYRSVFLRGVLASCKRVYVEFDKVRNVKDYYPWVAVAAEYPGGLSKNYPALINDTRKLAGFAEPDGLWYHTETQEEFSAACLMQSYTEHFNSCMYLPVHKFSAESQKRMVRSKAIFREYVDDIAYTKEYNQWQQCDAFSRGVRFYFQLDKNYIIKKRFYTCMVGKKLISSNHYNVSALPFTAFDSYVPPRLTKAKGQSKMYQNEPVSVFDLCSPLTEELFRSMMQLTLPWYYHLVKEEQQQ